MFIIYIDNWFNELDDQQPEENVGLFQRINIKSQWTAITEWVVE